MSSSKFMPFTPAHAIVAKPLTKVLPGVSGAAIAAGAMAPDLEFFWHLESHRTIGHLWPGALTLSLPLGALALLFWYVYLRPGVIALMPKPLEGVIAPRGLSRRDILPSVAGLLVGVATHIVWDLFTHGESYGAQLLGLSDTAATVLQLFSSVAGIAVLAVWAYPYGRQLLREPANLWFDREQVLRWKRAIVLGAAVGAFVLWQAALTASTDGLGPTLVWCYIATIYGLCTGLISAGIRLSEADEVPVNG